MENGGDGVPAYHGAGLLEDIDKTPENAGPKCFVKSRMMASELEKCEWFFTGVKRMPWRSSSLLS